MPDGRFPRTIPVLLVLLSFTIIGCPDRRPRPVPDMTEKRRPCGPGNWAKFDPRICVNDKLEPDPAKAVVYDVEEEHGPGHNPSNRPIVVRWERTQKAPLKVKFDNLECVAAQPVCNGIGGCVAVIKPIDWDQVDKEKGKLQLECTYQLFDDMTDPTGELIVNPCCQ